MAITRTKSGIVNNINGGLKGIAIPKNQSSNNVLLIPPLVKTFYDNVHSTNSVAGGTATNTVTIPANTFNGKITLMIFGGSESYFNNYNNGVNITSTTSISINGVQKTSDAIQFGNFNIGGVGTNYGSYSQASCILQHAEIDVDNLNDIVITQSNVASINSANIVKKTIGLRVIAMIQ